MRSSLSLCPLWALWVQQTRFWGSWQSSHSGTFRNRVKITGQVRVTRIQMQVSLVPGSQAHRGRFPLCSDPRGAASHSAQTHGGPLPSLPRSPRGSASPSTQVAWWGGLLPSLLRSLISCFHVSLTWLYRFPGLPWRLSCNKSACSAGDMGSIPESGRSPGEGNGSPLQYSCLRNPWTEEPGALQSMGSQSQTQLSDETTTALLSKQSIYYCSKLWKILITRKEDI